MRTKPVLFVILLLCCSCSPRALREAKQTVHEADSLRTIGVLYDDSCRIADAVRTLDYWKFFYPNYWAHANYHYGRLLSTRHQYTTAMQCYINITHTKLCDDKIKGRAYCNMGDMAHLQQSDTLALKLYQKSAQYFLRTHDSLLYAFSLTNVAFEMGCIKQFEKSSLLLDSATKLFSDSNLFEYCNMIRANNDYNKKQYNSALHYLNQIQGSNQIPLNEFYRHKKAQTYYSLYLQDSLLTHRDSASYYARQVIENKDNSAYALDAYYILFHDGTPHSQTELLEYNENRTDAHNELNLIDIEQTKAISLLQHTQKKHYLHIVYILGGCSLLLILLICIWYTIYLKQKGDK